MEVKEITLSANGYMKDYLNSQKDCEPFIDYRFNDNEKFNKRVDHLLTRTFQRQALADYFEWVHTSLPYAKQALAQIEKLRRENSVVVVGGQQAGLLTGPLYTVYKAMSIIILAKQQEEQLKIPVVPVFWIAGEDHDLDEIRFVYKEKGDKWKKHMYDSNHELKSASDVTLEKEEIHNWLNEVFATLPETAHTKTIMKEVTSFVEKSITFVDFFKRLMNWFFGEEGLLLLDAHDPAIRKLESNYFKSLISEIEFVQEAHQTGARMFKQAGYGEPILTEKENAHLFLDIDGERRRLDYENSMFFVKGTDYTFTKDELLLIVDENPERLSNNVVTRPLMQEWLLPVLSFISGPGELLYWGTLKNVFHHFNVTVPPIVPRLQITFVPVSVQKWLKEYEYDIKPFLEGKVEEEREKWLESVHNYPIEEVTEHVREQLAVAHLPIRKLANEMDQTLGDLSEKNLVIINQQIDFMKKKMLHFVRQSYDLELTKFTEAGRWLAPLNRPQERIFHPILLMNVMGEDGFRRLMSTSIELNNSHKLIYL